MSRFYEDALEARLHGHIASELATTIEILDDHFYQLDANASDDGLIYNWRVLWDDTAPPGVQVHGAPGSLWSNIAPAPDKGDE